MKRVLRASWKSIAMLAVLSVVVYQGFLASVRFEICQIEQQLGAPTSGADGENFLHRGKDNAAPLYAAAANLQRGQERSRSRRLALAEYRQDPATVDGYLADQKLAFEVLRKATAQGRCDFSHAELRGELDYIGYRSLVMAACSEMFRLASAGQHEEAQAMARDVLAISGNLSKTPSAIHLMMGVHYAEQVLATVGELEAAYPNNRYRQLDADFESLAVQLEKGLVECPAFERALMMSEFEKNFASLQSGGLIGSSFDLPSANAKLEYLKISRDAQEALKGSDQAQVLEALGALGYRSETHRTLAPKWDLMAQRTFGVSRDLKTAF